MTATVSITEADVRTVLRAFLIGIVPDVEVVAGLDNRVPEPASENFITMTPTLRRRLATNEVSYFDDFVTHERLSMQRTEIDVQLDVYGPASGDNAQIITTLLRDDYGCNAMGSMGFDIQPLYADDPRQMSFVNGENQYEERWIVDAVLQFNPVVSTSQQFADEVVVGIISVDVEYPPGA